jgi:hypothetical protein
VLSRVGVLDRLDEPVEARALDQVRPQRVEQPGPRAEDEVDGRAGDAGRVRDAVDVQRLGGGLPQAVVGGVEDAAPRLLGALRAQPLLVAPGGHRRQSRHFT